MENRLEITVLKMFDKLHWTFIENNDGLGLSISKLRKNSLLHMLNTLLEVSLKLQTNKQW